MPLSNTIFNKSFNIFIFNINYFLKLLKKLKYSNKKLLLELGYKVVFFVIL